MISQSHTDLKDMEIRGNNLHQRKSEHKMARNQNQQIVLSKQKNGAKLGVSHSKDPTLLAKKNAAIFGVEKKQFVSQNKLYEELVPDLLQARKDVSLKTPAQNKNMVEINYTTDTNTAGRKIVPMKEKTRNELMAINTL